VLRETPPPPKAVVGFPTEPHWKRRDTGFTERNCPSWRSRLPKKALLRRFFLYLPSASLNKDSFSSGFCRCSKGFRKQWVLLLCLGSYCEAVLRGSAPNPATFWCPESSKDEPFFLFCFMFFYEGVWTELRRAAFMASISRKSS